MPPSDLPPTDEVVDDPETVTASERTRQLIHDLAVGLTRLTEKASTLRAEALETEAARRAGAAAKAGAARTKGVARHTTETVKGRTGAAAHKASESLATARAIALGYLHKAESATEQTVERLSEMTEELEHRARKAKETGKDFYLDHREEILALLVTAAKVAAVVGVRRMTAQREDEEGLETRPGRQKAAKRVLDTAAILTAVVGQLGNLLAKQPSSLPMLRELYARGEPSEQAMVGMLLGPALSSDPDHAVEVVREFLEGATSGDAADTIARRTLAPLLSEHPELVERVTPWFQAAAPFVRRAALVSLSRFVGDRKSRVGHIVAAAVVVLEDHDEEVRQALVRLFRSLGDADPEVTARALAERLESKDAKTRDGTRRLLDDLPDDLQERVEAARTDREP